MKTNILLFLTLLAFLFVTSPLSFAADCDKITWDKPVDKGIVNPNNQNARVYTLSATVANCSEGKKLLIDLTRVRTEASQQPLTQSQEVSMGSGNKFSLDIDYFTPGKWQLRTLYLGNGVSATRGIGSNSVVYEITISDGVTLQCLDTVKSENQPICPDDCPAQRLGTTGDEWQCVRTQGTNYDTRDVKIVLKPKANVQDAYIVNRAYAQYLTSALPPQGTAPEDKNTPPNSSTCNGFYKLTNPLGLNFGDPDCTLDSVVERDNLHILLKSIDPVNADYWFFKIVPCESTYIANAYNPLSPAGGAWGLYQMGGPGTANSEKDHGDVSWQQQSKNAVDYNKMIGNSFKYWECSWL